MRKKSLSYKIILSISILTILIVFSCSYCIYMINKTQEYATDTGTNWMPSIQIISGINLSLGNLSRRIVLVIADSVAYQRERLPKNLEDLKKFRENLESEFEKFAKYVGPEEKVFYDATMSAYKEYMKTFDIELTLAKEGRGLEALNHYNKIGRPALFKFFEELTKEEKFNIDGGRNSTKKGENLTSLTILTMTIVLILSALVSSLIIFSIHKLTKNINKSIVSLKHQGDSTMDISKVLMKNSQLLSEAVTEQASFVHETTAAINQITTMMNKTSENANQSSIVAKDSSLKAEGSLKTMKKLTNSMETIQESNNQLQNIAEIINQIQAKTSVINDIVSKTELLSLNASIESARAGEYGKGFAVVAEEVGNLAKVSGKSAKEIQDLIKKSQEEVNKILGVTKVRVEEGKTVTNEVQESFVKISENITNMVSVIEQISSATKEQEIGVKQIITAMAEIDKTTQRNQSSATQTSASANELVEQGEKLNSTTKEIEIMILGASKKAV